MRIVYFLLVFSHCDGMPTGVIGVSYGPKPWLVQESTTDLLIAQLVFVSIQNSNRKKNQA